MANKRLNATITIGGAITGALKSALGTTRDKLQEIGTTIRKLEREQRMLGNSINTFGAMGKNVDGLRTRYAAVTAEIEKTRRAQEKLRASAEGMARGRGLMASGGIQLGVAAAAAAPFGMALNASAEFGYQLQMIGNTANMSKQEVVQLGEAIMAASEQTGQSATIMQKAIGFLVAAGMDVATSKAMLVQLGRTATATGADIEDLAKAAFVLNDTLKIKPGAEMAAALDTLAQAGKEGNVELKDMAKQLPVLGAGFASLKMEGREAAATMAAALEVARKGAADADEAANNMKNFIAKVMSPETLKKAQKNFGIDLYKIIQDAQKAGKNPFEASMQAIIKATKGDQKKIGELFQDMQVQNFLRPMIQNWEEYERIKNQALSASGVIDKDYASILETTKQQMNELSNASERAVNVIGGVMAPAFGSLLGSLTPVVNSIVTFAKENPTLTKTLLGAAGAVIGLTAALGAGKLAAGAIIYAWSAVPAVVTTVGTVFAWLGGTVLPLVAGGIRAIGLAIAANPLGAALIGLATAAVLIYQNWEPIKEFFVGLFESIKASVSSAIDWIIGKIQAVGEFWGKTKAFFGFGPEAGVSPQAGQPSATGAPGQPLPAVPSMATARGASQVVNAPQTNTFNITQQPGQNSKQLADEVARRLEEREAVRRRGAMFDPAMGY